jgi:hypothetical protein
VDNATHEPSWLFDAISTKLDIADEPTLEDLELRIYKHSLSEAQFKMRESYRQQRTKSKELVLGYLEKC